MRSLALYDEFVEPRGDRRRYDVEYERSGTLQVALTRTEATALSARRALAWRRAVAHALLDAGDVRGSSRP